MRKRILHGPQTSPATVILHPQAELLRLMMPFTYSCRSLQARTSPKLHRMCGVTGASSKRPLKNLHSASGDPTATPPHQTLGTRVWRNFHREFVGVLCCGWHHSWVAFSVKGAFSSAGGWSCTPPFNVDKTPRALPFPHFTLWYLSTRWDLADFLTPGLRYWVQWNQ